MSQKKLKVIKGEVADKVTDQVETQSTEQKNEYKFISAEDAKLLTDDELESKIKELEDQANSIAEEFKTKKYKVQVGNIKNVRSLLKFLEKNVNWQYNTLPSYISAIHGIKESIEEGVSEDGFIYLNAGPVGSLYQHLLQVTGVGYFEAKEFLKLLTDIGGGVSEAMKELADDNERLRNIHTDLSTLDTEKIAREQGIEVESTPTSIDEEKEVQA